MPWNIDFSDGLHKMIGMTRDWPKKSILDAYVAMAHAEYTCCAISRANPEWGVLCIDLGAHSNDATFVSKDGVASYGGYTGTSLIERMMLVQNFNNAYQRSKRPHNDADLLQTIIKKCNADRKFYNYILLQARKLKEMYYSANAEGASCARDMVVSVELGWQDPAFSDWDGDVFFLYTNDTMMNAVINELPICNVLGNEFNNLPQGMQNEIGNKTWADCLRTLINKATDLCPLPTQAAKGDQAEKATVILTGGAALMPFVQDIILEILPNTGLFLERERYYSGDSAEYWFVP